MSRPNQCKNDGNQPVYMKIFGTYYESSLNACCEKYFSWDISGCTGGTDAVPSGFYPNWGDSESKCLNSTETASTVPDYIVSNPEQWLESSAEACCQRYYEWDYNSCILQSGGAASVGSSQWYVDWSTETCVKDCNDQSDADCGGLANRWDELFGSSNECCSSKLWYIERSECTAS